MGENDARSCWICFESEDENQNLEWVKPCQCIGTLQWVHHACIYEWVITKRLANRRRRVQCDRCGTNYKIIEPNMGVVTAVMDTTDRAVYWSADKAATGVILVGTCVLIAWPIQALYKLLQAYGTAALGEFLGINEVQELIESSHPIFTCIVLPAIPIALICARNFHWEDTILTSLQRNYRHTYRTSKSFALLFPFASSFVGRKFFSNIENNFLRTFFGASSILLLRGLWNIYLKRQNYMRDQHIRVLDYEP